MTEFCKHTPGPWSFHEWGADGSGRQFGIETADHKHGIAGIQPNGNASSLISMEEHRANARLIAAAPTMADELEKLRKILAHVPARVALKAKEEAGYGVAVKCKARPSTGHPEVPTEYRCRICGGLVHYDGTPPAIYYSP